MRTSYHSSCYIGHSARPVEVARCCMWHTIWASVAALWPPLSCSVLEYQQNLSQCWWGLERGGEGAFFCVTEDWGDIFTCTWQLDSDQHFLFLVKNHTPRCYVKSPTLQDTFGQYQLHLGDWETGTGHLMKQKIFSSLYRKKSMVLLAQLIGVAALWPTSPLHPYPHLPPLPSTLTLISHLPPPPLPSSPTSPLHLYPHLPPPPSTPTFISEWGLVCNFIWIWPGDDTRINTSRLKEESQRIEHSKSSYEWEYSAKADWVDVSD